MEWAWLFLAFMVGGVCGVGIMALFTMADEAGPDEHEGGV